MTPGFSLPEFIAAFSEVAKKADFVACQLTELAAGPLLVWQRAAKIPGKAPHIYLSAGIHGDEPAGPLAMLALLQQGKLSPEITWSLCPALNPSGLMAGTRENATGHDLNRDYLVRETQEVAAHAKWLDFLPTPDLFISLHEDWETTGFYFYEIRLGEDSPQLAREILAAVRPHFSAEPGPEIDGHEVRENGWIYHAAEPDLEDGWPEAIWLAKSGCPLSFTFETPSQAPLDRRVAAHLAAVNAALRMKF